jgi:hypothetical protein
MLLRTMPSARKWLLAMLSIALGAALLCVYCLLCCEGLVPNRAWVCYARREHVAQLLHCSELTPRERFAATHRRVGWSRRIELELEVSEAELRRLEARCGAFDGLDARGEGSEAQRLSDERYRVLIRRSAGLRQN